jgi:hypothetical protein
MSCMYGCRTDGTAGCASTCPGNQDLCDGECTDTQSNPDACGSDCQVCSGSTPECSAGSCVQCTSAADCSGQGMTCTSQNACRCGVGYHACGATTSPCFLDTDVTKCGNGCTDCRQANANAACGAGDLCANTCKASAYTLSCAAVGGKPNCSQWDFESGSSEGWAFNPLDNDDDDASVGMFASPDQHYTGTAALAIEYDNAGDEYKWVEIRVQLCAGGNVIDLSDKRITWAFRMDPPQEYGYNYLMIHDAPGFEGGGGFMDFNSDTDGVWDIYDGELAMGGVTQVFGFGFHLQTTDVYSGTMYLDDVRIY